MIIFFVTWLFHLSALLAVAAIARAFLARERVAAREAWLKMALLGAPLTALLQTQWIEMPLGGVWSWEPFSTPAMSGTQSTPEGALAASEFDRFPIDSIAEPKAGLTALDANALEALSAELAAADPIALPTPKESAIAFDARWMLWSLFACWSMGVLALGARYLRRRTKLHRSLSARTVVLTGEAREVLDALCRDVGSRWRVTLSSTPHLLVPVAFGLRRGEICVPENLLGVLQRKDWEPLLAHELAHLVRRDPLWLLLTRLQSMLALGLPPLRWAERTLRADAEWMADAWAAARTSPLALARCLTHVADRVLHAEVQSAAFALAGHDDPTLTRRVERLLTPAELARSARGARGPRVLACLLCATLVLVAPALRSAAPREVEMTTPAAPSRTDLLRDQYDALHSDIEALRKGVEGTSLEVECAELFAGWDRRLRALRAEIESASLPHDSSVSRTSR